MGFSERGHGGPTQPPEQDKPSSPAGAQAPGDKNDRDRELGDLGYVDEIILSDDPVLHKELKEFMIRHGMSGTDVELSFDSRRLRHRVHEEMEREKERRLEENPAPTDVELSLGVYIEDIEPHVRDAVLELRKKGYSTRGSGFNSYNMQSVYLDLGHPDFADIPKEVREKLEDLGAKFDKEGRQITFACSEIDLGKMKAKWDEIVAELPNLDRAVIDHEPAYLLFAKNAKKYRGRTFPKFERFYDSE
jgi:hypothetical protein